MADTVAQAGPANVATPYEFGADNEDLNGECFIVGAEGEVEELIEKNYVIFDSSTPYVASANFGRAIAYTEAQFNRFMKLNVATSVQAGRSVVDSVKIAYLRFLAARNGLVSPDFDPAANNVRYNHAKLVNDAESTLKLEHFRDNTTIQREIRGALTVPDKTKMIRYFTDMVCCVAYIFRVRAHHYRDDLADRYVSLWGRCLHRNEDLVLPWELIATDALHAIMPNHLDIYWEESCRGAKCAGTLIKRYDSAPAGVAGVLALKRGLEDVVMMFPGVVNQVPKAHEYFEAIVDQVGKSRWGGSINSRFYGATRIRVDEGQIGALASVVMGIYEQLAPDSQLRNSPALKRLAETAPATGGAIGLAARRTVQSEAMNLLAATASLGPTAPV